ncbi:MULTISPECIES: acyl-CoA dehydrogenase family protein [Candidatus Microthrix]|jgi:alkylation response protein AidB-like acyl-CoA dehydrogenase|uniref:Putative Acyl-CoA dehydrogenase n=1 Tax=Candidatus Neomicrothrix parvicella RN1 TaxID=1229780 RepID=R4YYG4_9ACTN|nr:MULTISPECIES: acyl-CoA dehydrogenase family protein [Microthrix]NLH68121.1 acyl-CoA/acyl-ACP dehydrogenase [Candidatus Microthrix parvicella]MBK7018266.1 acyl-CoA/acyl-ACP dehydrogenase [Candidatus Microthrix sp.]MBP6135898.1 acyl-CoA/acyl-ACP dehydrogenase [Candidatus Microthrix sp.]MBP6149533.1 acyl-CoA/acyl-ACP dehydrogenase [Candidatus Microthrix sp.]MBP7877888.1 acyl-CoA/acyl-ACP dehydrogenase [Candidatus Microthrix sp.]
MNFAFSEEQVELRKVAADFLTNKSAEADVRALMETDEGYDPAVWSQMAEQLGLQGLAIPEEYGGSGYSYVELCVIFEEMGRRLLCAPFFSTVALAANALLHSGDDDAKARYLPGIASGETIATVAFTEENGRWDESGIEMEAAASDQGHTLTGTKSYVIDGHIASLILVAARTPEGVSLFAVDGDASGLGRTPLSTMDQTRKQAKLDFDNTPATLIGAAGSGWDTLRTMLQLAVVALASEQMGGAQECLDSAVQYAKDRVQFGRPIGSFQAIKHKLADMLLEVESGKSAAYYSSWCAAEMNDELTSVSSLAKSYCSEAYFHTTAENIQIHGGIGFTWEHPAHLYFKRAKSSELLFGDPTYHRELLAQAIGI